MKKQLNKGKGFTLVELIVIITILAILGTISFIALQGFAVNARDAKRTIDVKNLIGKINIEQTRGVNISDLIITDPHNIIINGTGAKSHQGIANFVNLKENEENFKDPLNKNQDYLLARASGEGYNFLQGATINETNETAVIMGSYYKINEEKDSESLFEIDGIILENGKTPMTYPLGGIINTEESKVGLIGYWDMETLTPKGKLKDLSGNGHDGTAIGAVFPTETDGYIGKAMYFSSGGFLVGYDTEYDFDKQLSFTSISNLYSYTNPYPRTFSNRYFAISYSDCRFSSCTNVDTSWQGYDSFGVAMVSGTGGTLIYNYEASLSGITGTGTAKSFTDERINDITSLNEYYHTAVVFDKNRVKVFVNGIKVSETFAKKFYFEKFPPENITNSGVVIGVSDITSRIRDFHGVIDEARIYNRALSDEEVLRQAKKLGF